MSTRDLRYVKPPFRQGKVYLRGGEMVSGESQGVYSVRGRETREVKVPCLECKVTSNVSTRGVILTPISILRGTEVRTLILYPESHDEEGSFREMVCGERRQGNWENRQSSNSEDKSKRYQMNLNNRTTREPHTTSNRSKGSVLTGTCSGGKIVQCNTFTNLYRSYGKPS